MSLKWIKLDSNFYFDDRMSLLKEYCNAPLIKLIYIGMLCLCGRRGTGRLEHKNGRAYSVSVLADMLSFDKGVVEYAIGALIEVGFLASDNGTLYILDWGEFDEPSDTYEEEVENDGARRERERARDGMRRLRDKRRSEQKSKETPDVTSTVTACNNAVTSTVTLRNTERNTAVTDRNTTVTSLKYLSLEENIPEHNIQASLYEEKEKREVHELPSCDITREESLSEYAQCDKSLFLSCESESRDELLVGSDKLLVGRDEGRVKSEERRVKRDTPDACRTGVYLSPNESEDAEEELLIHRKRSSRLQARSNLALTVINCHSLPNCRYATFPHKGRLYGIFGNVLLTDDEHAWFANRYKDDYKGRIDELSIYMAQTGKEYKNHLASLISFARLRHEPKSANSTNQNARVQPLAVNSEYCANKPREKPRMKYGDFDPEEALRNAIRNSGFFDDDD